MSVIRRSIAEMLHLQQVGRTHMIAAHGEEDWVPEYAVKIILPDSRQHLTRVAGTDLAGVHPLILGRDLLQKGVLTINGPTGEVVFEFAN